MIFHATKDRYLPRTAAGHGEPFDKVYPELAEGLATGFVEVCLDYARHDMSN
ncbi:MAG: hypothetical protein JW807_15375 [Spirochaetes bacterium]|nr:hypothetical protein [Spirochaetota bacterium]